MRKTAKLSSDGNPIISATSDLFIAALLSAPKNEPILRGIINAVLEDGGHVGIKTATILNPFNIKEFAIDKRIVLDVRVEDENSRIFSVEIQTYSHPAFVERILFGWADTYTAQLHAGNDYEKLKPVFCIVITEFKIYGVDDSAHFVFELRERNRPELVMSDHLQFHFLHLYGLLKGDRTTLIGISPKLCRWLNFMAFGDKLEENEMAQLVENDPLVMTAVSELQRFSADPEMRELERRRKLWKLEHLSSLASVREEGKAEGKAEGKLGMVLALLKRRFGEVPGSLADRLCEIDNLEVLDDLGIEAAVSNDLDEFASHLP